MSVRIFDLRDVPDDEADAIRGLLEQQSLSFYETHPSPFGVSNGALWLRDAADREQALRLISDYQIERARSADEERKRALQEGAASGFYATLRSRPFATSLFLFAILLVLLISAWPFFWMSG